MTCHEEDLQNLSFEPWFREEFCGCNTTHDKGHELILRKGEWVELDIEVWEEHFDCQDVFLVIDIYVEFAWEFESYKTEQRVHSEKFSFTNKLIASWLVEIFNGSWGKCRVGLVWTFIGTKSGFQNKKGSEEVFERLNEERKSKLLFMFSSTSPSCKNMEVFTPHTALKPSTDDFKTKVMG